jgi:hypothetical protein
MEDFSMTTINEQTEELTIEWAPFEVSHNVTDEQFIKSAQTLEAEFLQKQDGYIRRELLKGKNNQWVDLVYWASQEDAEAAVQAANMSDACMQYFSLMVGVENADADISHYRQIASWN